MTTLVETRRALELLSMGNQQERRTSKRLAGTYPDHHCLTQGRGGRKGNVQLTDGAAPANLEQDGDFMFVRETKRVKTEEPEPPKRAGRGRPPKGRPPKEAKGKSTKAAREPEMVPVQEQAVQSAQISLPMSDTPIINRNKEMRKKGSNRRSSLGSRGRRASSLIESGQTAIPHREVNPAEFYKHIEEGLTETRRMKQLLTWCGERALAVKPAHGTKNSSIIHGARAIQDQLLKDFSVRSEFSDWFSRDEGPKAPVILKPNPRNIELDEKMAQLEANIQRLQEEKRAWQAMRKLPPEAPQLYSEEEISQITLPDFDLLDEDDGKIRGYLADQSNSFAALHAKTQNRLQTIRSSLEFEIDQLADNIHKLDQRVTVAGKEAEQILSLSAVRLREREERERRQAGTKDMPIMEVLRSLGSILPEGGG
uniref:Kinetochore protein mis13 n=1 Tax=Bionectria ochroleuca TaxID=29856 RepID=A0A0B7JSB7_BIOOC